MGTVFLGLSLRIFQLYAWIASHGMDDRRAERQSPDRSG
jgi:hypothetical protein